MAKITLKALSLRPPWADAVASGEKTAEIRSWTTDYRGDILICASQRDPNLSALENRLFVCGHAIAIATLFAIEPFTEKHRKAAAYEDDWEIEPKKYAWLFKDVVAIEPIPVKGKLHLFEVELDEEQIRQVSINDFDKYAFAHGLCITDEEFEKLSKGSARRGRTSEQL
ncbi:MAG: ASCH domain-containing protein [Acidaminococcales bacterium]|nr:ASCH domain-containing protein [Acidaminococcales bacterium]